jgi:hypothetical protein
VSALEAAFPALGEELSLLGTDDFVRPAARRRATVDLQAWYRDPPNPGGANLTNAGSFVLGP